MKTCESPKSSASSEPQAAAQRPCVPKGHANVGILSGLQFSIALSPLVCLWPKNIHWSKKRKKQPTCAVPSTSRACMKPFPMYKTAALKKGGSSASVKGLSSPSHQRHQTSPRAPPGTVLSKAASPWSPK